MHGTHNFMEEAFCVVFDALGMMATTSKTVCPS